jgi:hypothetical protein
MATTLDEMNLIKEIIVKYVDPETMRKLSLELYEQVGKQTPNTSLSVTLAMLAGAFER